MKVQFCFIETDKILIYVNMKGSDSFNPVALRKAKIAYNFGLSECNRVKG